MLSYIKNANRFALGMVLGCAVIGCAGSALLLYSGIYVAASEGDC